MPNKIITLSLTGTEEVKSKLKLLSATAEMALRKTLYEIGNDLITEAKKQCPVDTGTLRSTGYASPPKKEFGVLYVECGFGGFAAPYAIYVHERTELRHKVGKAKFLEDPLKENAGRYRAEIEKTLKEMTK